MLSYPPMLDLTCCCRHLCLPLQWSTEPYCSNAAALLALVEDLLAGTVLAPPGGWALTQLDCWAFLPCICCTFKYR